jgi:glycosyltransferase involved in cell wall biosynthesis
MSNSADAHAAGGPSIDAPSAAVSRSTHESPGGQWRRRREREQQAVLPAGRALVTCSASLGKGGLGRHLVETLDALGRGANPIECVCGPLDRRTRPARPRARAATGAVAPLARFSPGWRSWRANAGFDARAAGAISGGEHLIAFAGQALEQLRVAHVAGCASAALMSATVHARALVRSHELAHRRHPLEPSWASRLLARSLREYEQADRIYVSSHYALESFLREGVSRERLSLFPLTPASRFCPDTAVPVYGGTALDTFDVVYVGGLSVVKGVPVLVDAFARLAHADMRLLLVGGAETRAMRRYLQQACARDPRIRIGPGDPLPILRAARLHVHPSYSDGFGYAPAEALACGVPVLVSEDTGMKELVEQRITGLVVPTGDIDALSEAIDSAYRGEILARCA